MALYHKTVVANWKMNTGLADAIILGEGLKKFLENLGQINVIVAPPCLWLYPLRELFSDCKLSNLSLAAQNMHFEEEGAYTGEISVAMIKKVADYVFIGHSERRQFGETPQDINRKLRLALEWKLNPILFISQEDVKISAGVLTDYLDVLINRVNKEDFGKIAFVYEPTWAISTAQGGHMIAGHELESVVAVLKKRLGEEAKVLYGGSVNTKNAAHFTHIPKLDGVVVGSDSLKLKNFIDICQMFAEGRES